MLSSEPISHLKLCLAMRNLWVLTGPTLSKWHYHSATTRHCQSWVQAPCKYHTFTSASLIDQALDLPGWQLLGTFPPTRPSRPTPTKHHPDLTGNSNMSATALPSNCSPCFHHAIVTTPNFSVRCVCDPGENSLQRKLRLQSNSLEPSFRDTH